MNDTITGGRSSSACGKYAQAEREAVNVIVHVLTETNRHAGHADILREQIDGAVGTDPESADHYDQGTVSWAAHRAKIEHAAWLRGKSRPTRMTNPAIPA